MSEATITPTTDPGLGVGGPPAGGTNSGIGAPPPTTTTTTDPAKPGGSDPAATGGQGAAPGTTQADGTKQPPQATAAKPGAIVVAKPPATLAAQGKPGTDAATTDADKPPTPADFPEDWRQKFAGETKSDLKKLELYNSPTDVWKALKAAQQRISSGELKKQLPTNPSSEELAEWRKDNNVPEKPDQYDTNLGNGVVWGELDKPILESLSSWAHSKNMPQGAVKDMLSWYVAEQDKIAERRDERDEQTRMLTEEALRAEWGTEFKRNLNAQGNYFAGAAEGLYDSIMTARDANGVPLGNRKDVLAFFADQARKANPYATLVPGGDGGAKSAETRFEELNKLQRDTGSDYYRGANKMELQAEWRTLYEMLDKGGSTKIPRLPGRLANG